MARPIEVIASILNSRDWTEFVGSPKILHQVFYELAQKNDYINQQLTFIKRAHPYSPTLEDSLTFLQLGGALSRDNPNFMRYRIFKDRLLEFLPEREEVPELDGLEVLDRLDCQPATCGAI